MLLKPEISDVYCLEHPPQGVTRQPVVVDSPHSGGYYPSDFKIKCAKSELIYAQDLYVDELCALAPKNGAPLMAFEVSRSYIDLNRRPDDLDPRTVSKDWDGAFAPSERARHGMGVIHRIVQPGVDILAKPLSAKKINHRLNDYYHPYHNKLQELVDSAYAKFDAVILLNMHATPSESINGPIRSDIILGDRKGTTCGREVRMAVADFLAGKGLHVAINDPYQGVEIVRRYGDPTNNRHALQIEINKACYMDEKSLERKAGPFEELQQTIGELVSYIGGVVRDQ